MAETKLANLINPQVMADMIAAELPKKIKIELPPEILKKIKEMK